MLTDKNKSIMDKPLNSLNNIYSVQLCPKLEQKFRTYF